MTKGFLCLYVNHSRKIVKSKAAFLTFFFSLEAGHTIFAHLILELTDW